MSTEYTFPTELKKETRNRRMHSLDTERLRSCMAIVYEGSVEVAKLNSMSEELASLLDTMGCDVTGVSFIRIKEENSSTLIGHGQLEELMNNAIGHDADLIVFSRDITPRVQRNLERMTGICVIDHQEVILQIFAQRAQTKEAVLQVSLARLQYSLPRLTRAWTNLSRQHGGVKGTRGEGEKQLELDRRRIQDKIHQIEKELVKVRQQRASQRKSRELSGIPKIAIVGYTNSGKSSFLRKLSMDDEIFVQNMLFATLDTTTRKVKLPKGTEVLFTDTVGFISDLPHSLVDAFRSTLEETVLSDILLEICDASHPDMIECHRTTLKVLEEIGCTDRRIITVINKTDIPYDDFQIMRFRALYPDAIEMSVKKGVNIREVLIRIENEILKDMKTCTFRVPASRYDIITQIRACSGELNCEYDDESVTIETMMRERDMGRFEEFLIS